MALSAAQAVAEMLQSPDDLIKIPAFKKKLEKEKASIDVKLKSGIKDQLNATRDALKKLHRTRDNVRVIQEEMISVEKMFNDPQNTIKTFDRISRVSTVHRNLAQTEDMVNNLVEMHDKLDVLERLLASEINGVPGPATNLLRIHYQLTQLETFRNNALYQAKKAKESTRKTMEKWFERLNKVIEDFEEYLWTLAQNILSIVRAGFPEVVVKIIKICEAEGKEDEKAIAIRLVKKAAKLDAASKFKSLAANSRGIKHYRPTLTKKITEAIQRAFDNYYEEHKDNPQAFLDGMDWMYKDIIRIQDDIVDLFPPSYDIYSLYIRTYHKSLDGVIKKMVSTDADALTLLAVHSWLKEYKKTMKELDIPPELMEPALLDGKEQSLIQDYLQLIVKKMDEWTNNLMKTEIHDFTVREEQPEIDADGMYGTQGAVIMFKMINQQADAAIDSGQGIILRDVVREGSRVMRSTQEQWSKLIDSESKKQVEKPEECPPGLVEYIIALANDQIKCADYTEKLSERLEPLVSDKYKNDIADSLNDALEGYLDVATKKCVTTLIDLIYNDLKPALKQLFTSAWYDGIMKQIVETMRDYMSDYREHLNPLILDVLVEELIDTFIVTYLTSLGNASKLRMPATIDRIKDDVREMFQFFSTLKPAKDLEEQFDVVDLVLGLLEASRSMAFLSFWDFAKVHGPNPAFVESLMRARDDFDRSAANEVMESIKRKIKDEGLTDPEQPTIMKKIQLQSTFQRLLNTATSRVGAS